MSFWPIGGVLCRNGRNSHDLAARADMPLPATDGPLGLVLLPVLVRMCSAIPGRREK